MRHLLALALPFFVACHCNDALVSTPGDPVPHRSVLRPPAGRVTLEPGTPPTGCTAGSCESGMVCDLGSQTCVEGEMPEQCTTRNPTAAFTPALLWRYDAQAPWDQTMMTPLAIDLTADGIPDVVATFYSTTQSGQAVLIALDGNDGHVLWTSPEQDLSPLGNIAAADLDGDGTMEIVALTNYSYSVVAHSGVDGHRLWTAKDMSGNDATCAYGQFFGPAIANLDGLGDAEVYCGLSAWDSHGAPLFMTMNPLEPPNGPLTIAIDLDGDGKLEVTDGAHAIEPDGSTMATFAGAGFMGLPAAGDFVDGHGALGRDGSPEIVVVGNGQLALVDGQTGNVLAGPTPLAGLSNGRCDVGLGSPGNGGAPTVADYDGDGKADVGAASMDCYSVFTLDDSGGSLTWRLLWAKQVQDHSSSSTGSSVFDFDGDGRAEVVYADEIALHVYNGPDGAEILTQPHCSGTAYENPIIVDVNGDGHADLVVPENDYAASILGCDMHDAKAGIRVYRDAMNAWMPTRKIWNQHAYHITNVCDGADQVCGGPNAPQNKYGAVPARQEPNWAFTNLPPGQNGAVLNNFRMNTSGNGLNSAPDLVGRDLKADCTKVSVRVVNLGEVTAPAGISVAFFANGMLLGSAMTHGPLAPGASETVSLPVSLPNGGAVVTAAIDNLDTVTECREDNNGAGPVTASCAS
jgi:hypothetical protein